MSLAKYHRKIEALDRKIKILRWDENKAIEFVAEQKIRLRQSEISKKEYNLLLRKRLHDLSLASYIRKNKDALHKCLRLKNKYENIHREGNYFKAGIAAAIFIFIISFFVFQYPNIIGFVIGPEGDIIEEEVDLFFDDGASYNLILQENIDSFLISGSFTGSVKVYLNDINNVVLDSDVLSSTGITSITGMVILEGSDSNETPELNHSVSLVVPGFFYLAKEDSFSLQIVNNEGYELNEISLTAISSDKNVTLSFDQAYYNVLEANGIIETKLNVDTPILVNYTIELRVSVGSPESSVNKTLSIETLNISIEINETELNITPENITEEINITPEEPAIELPEEPEITPEINVTPENVTPEINITPVEVIEFSNVCVDTCFLDNVDKNITLIIEIEDGSINITKIKYKKAIEENITKKSVSLVINNNLNKTIEEITLGAVSDDVILSFEQAYYSEIEPYGVEQTSLEIISKVDKYNITINLTAVNYSDSKVINENTTEVMFEFVEEIELNISENISINVSLNITANITLNITNATIANISQVNITENLTQGFVVVNKPVKWVKTLNASNLTFNFTTDIHKEASNINVSKIINGTKEKVDLEKIKIEEDDIVVEATSTNLITGSVVYSDNILLNAIRWLANSITGFVVGIPEDNKTLIIEDIADEILIEYETPGPTTYERELEGKDKRILVSSDIHYENILAYTVLNNIPKEAIKLYHIVNNSRVPVSIYNYIDIDEDGLIDEIQWIVPHLSSEEYEVDITILNVQSYPMVGGLWTVMFTTIGKEDLTITAINGTTYGSYPNDLELLKISCGDKILTDNVYVVDARGNKLPLDVYLKLKRIEEIKKELEK